MDMKTSPLALLKDPSLLKTDALINGQWVKGASRFAVHDPATGAHLADVANLGPAETEQAIAAANAAWPVWRSKTAKERSIILRKWFDLLMANQDDLGRIMTAEQGKPLPEAKGEVAYGASFVEWFAEEAKRVNGETMPPFDNNKRLLVIRQPMPSMPVRFWGRDGDARYRSSYFDVYPGVWRQGDWVRFSPAGRPTRSSEAHEPEQLTGVRSR